ncbi:MAG: cytochrome c3 family protein, partial [Limisphaerales bacterium]
MVKSTKKQSPKPKQGLAPVRDERSPTNKRIRWIVVAPLALFAMAVTAFFYVSIGPQSTSLLKSPVDVPPPAFVGSDACIGCHKAEGDLWRASQHNHAMAHATEQTVLGDFSDVKFEKFGVQSRFFRRDGKFLVETDGPDGKLATFEIKYTFGVDPLQQYLIEFPDGRLQALSIAWDVRPRDKGGQRWFHLYPDEEIKHDDVLHWTKLNQNWNFMCAECHSTGVRKNYDSRNDRFATTWAEISVGCEGCHGQGSHHLDWARRQKSWWPFGKTDDPLKGLLVYFNERQDVTWLPDAKTGNAKRSAAPVALRKEVETCGLCHARRSQISEGWVPGRSLSDTHVVSPLSRGLYYPDGQMHDEVYNYGSFKQSKMFASGVTCSDCHEPHSAKPKLSGNDTCVQCHSPEKYSVAAHHHHDATKAEVTCASCHMPARTYMVVDVRHDHSFRVPRPDLSAKHETPNACTDCHSDKSAAWAATEVERWYGPVRKGFQNYAEAFHAAWGGEMNAATQLAAIATDGNVPAFTRAGALTELGSYLSSATVDTARKGLADPDPMVRIGSLDMLDRLPLEQRISVITPLLTDPVRGERIRAVALLAGVPDAQFPAGTRERFDRAAAEFIAALRLNADRPEANSTVG